MSQFDPTDLTICFLVLFICLLCCWTLTVRLVAEKLWDQVQMDMILAQLRWMVCIKLNRVQVYVLYHNMQTLSSLYCFGYWKSFFGKAEGRQKEIVDLVFLWKSLKCFLVFHIVLFNTDSGWLHRKFRKENKLKKKKSIVNGFLFWIVKTQPRLY